MSDSIAQCIQDVEAYTMLEGGVAEFACTELLLTRNQLALEPLPLITITANVDRSTADRSINQSADRLASASGEHGKQSVDEPKADEPSIQASSQSSNKSITSSELSYPLPLFQIHQLISIASQAPFGKGEQTLFDRSIRNTWQINAENITIDSSTMSFINHSILPRVCERLGLTRESDMIEARLYKLLIYETGGHFAPHRDSEKEDGMFGTLVVLLPSQYTGGQLSIEHAGKSLVVDWSEGDSWRSFAYAAFYADCRHEIKKVTSGYRVALTFNLCMVREAESDAASPEPVLKKARVDDPIMSSGSGNRLLPTAASLSNHPEIVHRLADSFISWTKSGSKKHCLLLALEHQYTQASLSRDSLKGADRALMSLVDQATDVARQKLKLKDGACPPVVPLLCLFDYSSCGFEEHPQSFSGSYTITNIVPLSLTPPPRSLPLFHSLIKDTKLKESSFEVLFTEPDFDWDEKEADEEDEEATGNEGTEVTKFYHKAGILLVNASARWEIVQALLQPSDLLLTFQNAVSAADADLDFCMDLARCMLISLPDHVLSGVGTVVVPSFIEALSKLQPLVHDQGADAAAVHMQVSSHVTEEEFSSMMVQALCKRRVDITQPSAVVDLDRLATTHGMKVTDAVVKSEFALALAKGMYIADGAKLLLRFFLLGYSLNAATSDSLSLNDLALVSKKANAGVPDYWRETVFSLCCTLYDEARADLETYETLLPLLDQAGQLLTLLTMHWLCLMTQSTSRTADVEECIKTIEWLSSYMTRCKDLPNPPEDSSKVPSSFLLTLSRLQQIVQDAASAYTPQSTDGSPSVATWEAQLSQISSLSHELFGKA